MSCPGWVRTTLNSHQHELQTIRILSCLLSLPTSDDVDLNTRCTFSKHFSKNWVIRFIQQKRANLIFRYSCFTKFFKTFIFIVFIYSGLISQFAVFENDAHIKYPIGLLLKKMIWQPWFFTAILFSDNSTTNTFQWFSPAFFLNICFTT